MASSLVLREIQDCVNAILEISKVTSNDVRLRHVVFQQLERLSMGILAAEDAQLATAVTHMVEPLWPLFGKSPFLSRIQNWPRGYPGDFDTIEYLMKGVNTCEQQGLPHFVEEYFLRSATAQQHRHKLDFQEREYCRAIEENPGQARILSIASGSAIDLTRCVTLIQQRRPVIVLNDQDADALEAARSHLAVCAESLTLCPGNALKFLAKLCKTSSKFDLIVAGGLFDYLSDVVIGKLVRLVQNDCLNDSGRMIFTNIAKGNPLRPLMEYTASWSLIERDEQDYENLLAENIGKNARFDIARDVTRLSLLITLFK